MKVKSEEGVLQIHPGLIVPGILFYSLMPLTPNM